MIAEVCVRHCRWTLSVAEDAKCCNLILTAAKCDEMLVCGLSLCYLVFQEH
jgi:hypothetical protein